MLVKICTNRWIDSRCIRSLITEDYEEPQTHKKTYLIVVGGIDYEGKSFEGTLPQEYDKWLTALDAMDKFAERINKEKE